VLAHPLTAGEGKGPNSNCDNGNIIAFDTTQITSAANYSNPKAGDPCHPLAAGAHAPAIAHCLRAEGFDASEDGTGRGTPIVAQAVADPITASFHKHHGASAGKDSMPRNMVVRGTVPRRLTPRECERLQGFPDGWTEWGVDQDGKRRDLADGPRYRMLGNAVTVNVVSWIGKHLATPEREEPDV